MAEYDFDGRVAFVTGAARGPTHEEMAEQSGPDDVLGEIVQPEDASATAI